MAIRPESRRTAPLDREWTDTAVLVGAFLLGIGSSLTLRVGELPAWLPALTSGAVVVSYAAIAFASGRARLEPDQTGDNAYYLGFVLTLTSLAWTLYELGPKSAGMEHVISGFGVALSSTIVGVIVRVILLQYRVDLVAREKEARFQLNDAMRRFHVEVEDVVRSTKLLGAEIRQSLDEHHRRMAESSGASADVFRRSLEETAKAMSEGTGGLRTEIRRCIDEMSLAHTENRKREVAMMEEAATSMQAAIGSIAGTLERSMGEVEAKMAKASDMTVRINAAMESMTKRLERSVRQVSGTGMTWWRIFGLLNRSREGGRDQNE